MRVAAVSLALTVLGGCDLLISEQSLVGSYRASWDSEQELALGADHTYRRTGGSAEDDVGDWYRELAYGNARVVLNQGDRQGSAVYEVHRTISGELVITVNADAGRAFVKVD